MGRRTKGRIALVRLLFFLVMNGHRGVCRLKTPRALRASGPTRKPIEYARDDPSQNYEKGAQVISRSSQAQNEFGERFGHQRANRIGELLLFVNKASFEPEPIGERLQSSSLP